MQKFQKLLLLALLILPACDGFGGGAADVKGVYIVNQGIFGQNNGSVTVFNPEANAVVQDAIPNLKSLLQSLSFSNGYGYLTANTGNRLEVFDAETSQRLGQISNVSNIRYFVAQNDEIGYATDLYNNKVHVLDLKALTVKASLTTGPNPEGLVLWNNQLIVANYGFGFSTTLSVFDTGTNQLTRTIDLKCDAPRAVFVDEDDEIWAVCDGKTEYNMDYTQIIAQTNAEVVVLDGHTFTEQKRFKLTTQAGAASFGQDAYYAKGSEELYVVAGGKILRFNTATNAEPEALSLHGSGEIGGLAYDAKAERLYVSRLNATNPYTAAGSVYVYDRAGTHLNTFTAGLVPTHIALR